MKLFALGMVTMLLLFVVLSIVLHNFGKHPRHAATAPDAEFLQGLEQSEASAAIPRTPEEAETWLNHIRSCFAEFSEENLSQTIAKAYASTFYFRDAFFTLHRREDLSAYFLHSAQLSPGVTFEFQPAIWNGADAYLPWTMILPPGNTDAPQQQSIGLSRLRFNANGQVIFHQDYWDSADVLVPRVPLANGLIELVRRRF